MFNILIFYKKNYCFKKNCTKTILIYYFKRKVKLKIKNIMCTSLIYLKIKFSHI